MKPETLIQRYLHGEVTEAEMQELDRLLAGDQELRRKPVFEARTDAGEFIMANPHLMQDLTDRGLWNQNVRNQLMRDGGSVASIKTARDFALCGAKVSCQR